MILKLTERIKYWRAAQCFKRRPNGVKSGTEHHEYGECAGTEHGAQAAAELRDKRDN